MNYKVITHAVDCRYRIVRGEGADKWAVRVKMAAEGTAVVAILTEQEANALADAIADYRVEEWVHEHLGLFWEDDALDYLFWCVPYDVRELRA